MSRGRGRQEALGDEEVVEARRRREERAGQQEVDDLRWLLADARGRRFMWRLLNTCGIFTTSFTGNSTTFFNEGARNVGLRQLANINEHCAERYLEMIQEANTAKAALEREERTDG